MFTQTIIPDSSSIILQLPEDFVGEQVTLIAIVEKKERGEFIDKSHEERLKEIKETLAQLPRIDHTYYKFNREEANDFE